MKVHITTDEGELMETVSIPDAELSKQAMHNRDFAQEAADVVQSQANVLRTRHLRAKLKEHDLGHRKAKR